MLRYVAVRYGTLETSDKIGLPTVPCKVTILELYRIQLILRHFDMTNIKFYAVIRYSAKVYSQNRKNYKS